MVLSILLMSCVIELYLRSFHCQYFPVEKSQPLQFYLGVCISLNFIFWYNCLRVQDKKTISWKYIIGKNTVMCIERCMVYNNIKINLDNSWTKSGYIEGFYFDIISQYLCWLHTGCVNTFPSFCGLHGYSHGTAALDMSTDIFVTQPWSSWNDHRFNSLAPGWCGIYFKLKFSNSCCRLNSWTHPMKLLWCACCRTPLMISQHRFR